MKSKGWAPWKPSNWWKVRGGHPLKTYRSMKSEGWAPLRFDADYKKCQICVVHMTIKTGTLFLLPICSINPMGCPPLGTTSLGQVSKRESASRIHQLILERLLTFSSAFVPFFWAISYLIKIGFWSFGIWKFSWDYRTSLCRVIT